jgi:DNA-binding PadR family transcriptional regulator
MTIKYALLGLLAHTPRHGYEMKQEFERTFSQMRAVSAGQVYAQMTRLAGEGKVSCETVEQKNSPARKVYQLTEEGRQDLMEWLETPVADTFENVRSQFFQKLMVHALVVGSHTDGLTSWTIIEQQQAHHKKHLEDLKRNRLKLSIFISPGEVDPRSLQERELNEMRILLLEGAILHLEADMQWLGLLAARLDRLAFLRSGD